MIRIVALAVLCVMSACAGAAADECDRFAVAVATQPAPHQYPRGLEKAEALLAHVPSKADVIVIGDSLAANWPMDLARRQFASGDVWNFAVGGATSQNTLWQIGMLHSQHLEPHDLVMVIGTNNLTRDDMPACAIAAGIRVVAMAAHAAWPAANIHLMGIPPRGPGFRFRDPVRLAVNREIRTWAGHLPYLQFFEVDASEITCGHYDRPATVPQSDCANYADDFGHFERAGYDLIFKAMTQK